MGDVGPVGLGLGPSALGLGPSSTITSQNQRQNGIPPWDESGPIDLRTTSQGGGPAPLLLIVPPEAVEANRQEDRSEIATGLALIALACFALAWTAWK